MPMTQAGWFPAARLYRPIHWRLFALAGMFVSAGAGFVFGWLLVREGGGGHSGASPYRLTAPGWLPVAGAASAAIGIAGLIVVHLSAPVSHGERLPEHLRRPVDERSWPAAVRLMTPFVAAMVITSIASTRSADRWEPVVAATAMTLLATPMGAWVLRRRP